MNIGELLTKEDLNQLQQFIATGFQQVQQTVNNLTLLTEKQAKEIEKLKQATSAVNPFWASTAEVMQETGIKTHVTLRNWESFGVLVSNGASTNGKMWVRTSFENGAFHRRKEIYLNGGKLPKIELHPTDK